MRPGAEGSFEDGGAVFELSSASGHDGGCFLGGSVSGLVDDLRLVTDDTVHVMCDVSKCNVVDILLFQIIISANERQ